MVRAALPGRHLLAIARSAGGAAAARGRAADGRAQPASGRTGAAGAASDGAGPGLHAQLLARIAAKDAVIRALYASTSWSITAPIRALADLLRRTQPAALERVIAATDQLPAAPPMPELPGAASVRITRGRPRPGSLGEVLVVADHLPLFDQQSGGLRLQTLIGMIGELGWTITFGSFWPETGPGILATEEGRGRYETALRAAGVTDFAYGLEGIRQCLQEAGGRVRFALISFPTVAHEVMPLVRSYCP